MSCSIHLGIGSKFGRWEVMGSFVLHGFLRYYPCRCCCGTEREVYGDHLVKGKSKSCGCWKVDRLFQHGDTRRGKFFRLRRIWVGMRSRCRNGNDLDKWKYYGGKGIKVCRKWDSSYLNFKVWALSSGYTDCLVIDRIDSSRNYCPSNCRWITPGNNTSRAKGGKLYRAFGDRKNAADWSRDSRCEVSVYCLRERLRAGIPIKQAMVRKLDGAINR